MSPEFSEITKKRLEEVIARYPKKNAALLPVLHLVQQEVGYISADEEKQVAALLEIKPIQVREVVTFYTMYNRQPIGKYHIQVCSNLSCSLLGAETLIDHLKEKLGIELGETTEDQKFTLTTVECLGACEQAPCMMINYDYYGDLDPNRIDEILDNLE
ncbi:MAG: NADH-quinone oxidoreductase subunit NuoE [Candidatus Aminicenantes bacterium]|jgi:NADH-quinone oxidoreductase E subunit